MVLVLKQNFALEINNFSKSFALGHLQNPSINQLVKLATVGNPHLHSFCKHPKQSIC